MTAKDAAHGWRDMPALSAWKCPECGVTSPTENWSEGEIFCGMCEHDARECPACGEFVDFIFDMDALVAANRHLS